MSPWGSDLGDLFPERFRAPGIFQITGVNFRPWDSLGGGNSNTPYSQPYLEYRSGASLLQYATVAEKNQVFVGEAVRIERVHMRHIPDDYWIL